MRCRLNPGFINSETIVAANQSQWQADRLSLGGLLATGGGEQYPLHRAGAGQVEIG